MKKVFLLLSIMLLVITQSVFATSDITIQIDGHIEEFSPGPVIENGSTLVPMRAFFETMGAKVDWNDDTKSITARRGSTLIGLTIGNLESYINGNKYYLSIRPKIIDDKTYVPLRFIGESLGAEVLWNGNTRTISIKDKTKQPLKPFTLVDTQKYELQNIFKFVNDGDMVDFDLQILAGTISTSPYQNDLSIDISPAPYDMIIDDYGNKYAKIKVENVQRGQKVDVVVKKTLSNSGISYSIDENNISDNYSNLNGYNIYISPQRLIESDNSTIIKKANSLVGLKTNPLLIAKNIYGFVNDYLTYDKSEQYAGKGALSSLLTGYGVCEEYSKLFVALLRAEKVPARSVFGYWLADTKDKIGYDWYDVSDLKHEWPEFYLSSYGWIISEPTYSYTYNGVKSAPWDQFANQNGNGHILYGYEPDTDQEIKWSVKGYGSLNVKYIGEKEEIRKVR